MLWQPVDAQVEIVTRTANGEKVRFIARQNSEVEGGSSRLKAMKVCPAIFSVGVGYAGGLGAWRGGAAPCFVILHPACGVQPSLQDIL